jgi:hypothetical protein
MRASYFAVCLVLGVSVVIASPVPDDQEVHAEVQELEDLNKEEVQPALESPTNAVAPTGEFGFNPMTFKLIATLVGEAEKAAERQYVNELLQEVDKSHHEVQAVEPASPPQDLPLPTSETALIAKDAANEKELHQKYSNQLKMFLEHLPFPLSQREAPPQ